MNRNLIIPILVILFTSFFALSIHIHTAEASGTIYIRAEGNVDPPAAPIATSDNITYILTANVSDSVIVQRDNIIVDGAGYTVQGAGNGNGISLVGRDNVTITHVTIKAFSIGILLTDASDAGAVDNEITDNHGGIKVTSSFNTNISQNDVRANSGNGIEIDQSSNSTVYANNVTANSGLGIWLYNSSSNVLSNNNMANNNAGIYLLFSPNNVLSGNMIGANKNNFGVYGTDLSMYLQSIDASNLVDGKPIYYLVNQSSMIISPPSYTDAGYIGVVNCVNMSAQDFDITNNIQGILLAYTNDSKVIGTNLANNSIGMLLWSSFNNMLTDNSLTNNDIGISTYYSNNNRIFHNSMNNPTQFDTEYSSDNTWDDGYPSGGNYWSDYNGTDSNRDGIGVSSYTIDPNNVDRYPLMGTHNSFSASLEQTVQTICNSTISNFAFNGTAINFNVFGETGTAGFCRICIPTTLMGSNYRMFINGTEVTYMTLSFSNSTHKYLYFNYTLSTRKVTIIPEFTSFLTLALLMATTLLALIVFRRKCSLFHTPSLTVHFS